MRFSPGDSYADFESKVKRLYSGVWNALTSKLSNDWKQAQCNPAVRKHVTPRVEFVWHACPFHIILGNVAWLLDVVTCPVWICLAPLWICILPWNICFLIVSIPLVLIFFLTLPCVTCWACIL